MFSVNRQRADRDCQRDSIETLAIVSDPSLDLWRESSPGGMTEVAEKLPRRDAGELDPTGLVEQDKLSWRVDPGLERRCQSAPRRARVEMNEVWSEEVEQQAVAFPEVPLGGVEQEDFRVPRRCGQSNLELELDVIGPKVLEVDLEPVQLSSRNEIRQLVRPEVAGLRLVDADRVLVFEPPEGAQFLIRRNRVDLGGVRTTVQKEHTSARLIELAIADEVARDEVAEPIEDITGEWIGPTHSLRLAEKTQRALEISSSQCGHEATIRRTSY